MEYPHLRLETVPGFGLIPKEALSLEAVEYGAAKAMAKEYKGHIDSMYLLSYAAKILPYLESYYKKELFEKNAILNKLGFERDGYFLFATQSMNTYLQMADRYLEVFNEAYLLEIPSIRDELKTEIQKDVPFLGKVYPYALALEFKKRNKSPSYAGPVLYYYISHSEEEKQRCQTCLRFRFDQTGGLPRKEEILAKRLSKYGIRAKIDLSDISVEKVMALFPFDLDKFHGNFKDDEPVEISSLEGALLEIRAEIPEKCLEISLIRHGAKKGTAPMTLAEVGEIIGVSRARIGQIEQSVRKPLEKECWRRRLMYEEFVDLYRSTGNGRGFLFEEDLEEFLKDEEAMEMARLIGSVLKDHEWSFHYSNEFGLFYFGDLEETMETVFSDLPDLMSQSELERIDPRVRRAIVSPKGIYRLSNGIYAKKGIRPSDIYLTVLEEAFPDGYRIYNDDDYHRLEEEWTKRFGRETVPTAAAIRGTVGTYWQMAGRGLYLPPDRIPELPLYLYGEMVEFISKHLPAVYYASIYGTFGEEIREIGIVNIEMFKGAFDRIDSRYTHRQDYLCHKDYEGTAYDSIYEKAKNFKGVFKSDDLRIYFPYVEGHTFSSCLWKRDDILFLGEKGYFYFYEGRYSQSFKDNLRDFVNHYLDAGKTDVISSYKLYDRMQRFRPDLIKESVAIVNSYGCSAIIGALLKEDFDVLPYQIARKGKLPESREAMLNDYLEKNEVVTKNGIDCLFEKNAFSTVGMPNFYSLVQRYSDRFVRIANDTMAKKEYLALDEDFIESFLRTFNMYLALSPQWDSRTFDRYFSFPDTDKLTFDRFSVSGLLLSYGEGKYDIQATSNDYRDQHFIIRRKNHA